MREVALARQLFEPLDGEAGGRERVEEVAQGEVDPADADPDAVRVPDPERGPVVPAGTAFTVFGKPLPTTSFPP